MIAGLAALVVIPPSLAQGRVHGAGGELSGQWRFETAELEGKACRISGEMTIRPAAGEGRFTCEFVSRETCQREPANTFQVVRQICTASLDKGELTILSRVGKVLDAGPADVRSVLMNPASYRADNFRLQPRSASEMTGEFFSINRARVRFWREEDLVS